MFLISGAVFPLAVLPQPIQALGLATPLTWWSGRPQGAVPGRRQFRRWVRSLFAQLAGRASPEPPEIIAALLVTGALVTLAATGIFRCSERRARDRGLLDQTTGS